MGLHMPGPYEELKALDYLMRDGEQPGRQLRAKINADLCQETEFRQTLTRLKLGWLLTLSGPAYYQMMAKLEDQDEVESWYEDIAIDEYHIKERWHRIKEGGHRRLDRERNESLIPDYKVGWVLG